jgi:hypothetical protein
MVDPDADLIAALSTEPNIRRYRFRSPPEKDGYVKQVDISFTLTEFNALASEQCASPFSLAQRLESHARMVFRLRYPSIRNRRWSCTDITHQLELPLDG